ncbi:MAG TPA: sulfite exporter TauE/SafE family protein [Acetobacteraceae bacterium]|jgi:sulfite exporter TauE/SafE|nr:sulfite exporter TauE/SafE family protein [Acetobacteraceae bacterium]
MLAEFCGTLPLTNGLFLGLFLAGAAGSTMHCVPMCGGFVLGQVADGLARMPAARLCEWRRITNGALLPYHLGRLTTYAGLGALAGFGAGRLPWFGTISAALLLLGATLFLLHVGRILPGLERAPATWNLFVTCVARRAGGGYPLGIALGFLPCGFLYAALATAASSGNPLLGAAAMLAFGLGTAPALIAVGIAGQAAGRRWQRGIAIAAPTVMVLNATLLLVLALRGFATSL